MKCTDCDYPIKEEGKNIYQDSGLCLNCYEDAMREMYQGEFNKLKEEHAEMLELLKTIKFCYENHYIDATIAPIACEIIKKIEEGNNE